MNNRIRKIAVENMRPYSSTEKVSSMSSTHRRPGVPGLQQDAAQGNVTGNGGTSLVRGLKEHRSQRRQGVPLTRSFLGAFGHSGRPASRFRTLFQSSAPGADHLALRHSSCLCHTPTFPLLCRAPIQAAPATWPATPFREDKRPVPQPPTGRAVLLDRIFLLTFWRLVIMNEERPVGSTAFALENAGWHFP